MADGLSSGPSWSASENSIQIFRQSRGAEAQLTWFDREGKPLGTAGDPARLFEPRISPDQKTIASDKGDAVNENIWLFDTARGTSTRFSFEPGSNARDQCVIKTAGVGALVFHRLSTSRGPATSRRGGASRRLEAETHGPSRLFFRAHPASNLKEIKKEL